MTHRNLLAYSALIGSVLVNGCTNSAGLEPISAGNSTAAISAESSMGASVALPAINAHFEKFDAKNLGFNPLTKTYRGIRDGDDGRWTDPSESAREQRRQLRRDSLAQMRANYDVNDLLADEALSFRLFEAVAHRSALLHPFDDYSYNFDQMNGEQSGIPAFLINVHRVANVEQAQSYIERISGIGPYLDELVTQSKSTADDGIMPPDWVYPYVLSDISNLLGAGHDNAVLVDIREKVGALEISDDEKAALIASATEAWDANAKPAYERLHTEMLRQQAMAPTDDGVWRFPEGEAYYKALLEYYTTTDLTADQVHDIGLREVARIHDEMRGIMTQVGFEGTLQEFFEHTRTGDEFFYATREGYLSDTAEVMDAMEARLPDFFITLPDFPLVVKPVEAFREQSAGKAFYNSPAPDGSRPGTYYVNLYNLRDMSKNELEALAYHEGLPGHHMQRSIQTGLDGLPPFRRFGGFTAYTEGWGLYSEELGKDMGFYTEPYSDFGRLGMELWRACRLVVDTGMHDKRWSREEAIAYLTQNTPNPDGDIRKAIERYIVYPGQATAYMIGKLKIKELRGRAQAELGSDFDIRQFHEVVLADGPVPLSILEENVDMWIASQKN